jgi:hypothetical protein
MFNKDGSSGFSVLHVVRLFQTYLDVDGCYGTLDFILSSRLMSAELADAVSRPLNKVYLKICARSPLL